MSKATELAITSAADMSCETATLLAILSAAFLCAWLSRRCSLVVATGHFLLLGTDAWQPRMADQGQDGPQAFHPSATG